MSKKKILVLGGTGFVGTQLCARLEEMGYSLRVPTRRRERNRHLLVLPGLELVNADIHDATALEKLCQGVDIAINLVGILNERGNNGAGFRHAHVALAEKLVAACKSAGVPRLLQMSALNASATEGPSYYLRTKGEAENLVHASGLAVTSFRPSVIFGTEDSFINRFADLLRLPVPVFPLACPQARFAPVYVGDVVEAFACCVEDPASYGQRYDLCGPKSYTLLELVTYIRDQLGLSRWLSALGPLHSKLQATLLNFVPGKPFSLDNHASLQVDSVCKGDNGLKRLGIRPASLESIVPTYLKGQRQRGRYAGMRSLARRT